MQIDLYSPNSARFLQLSQVELRPEKPLSLPENRAYDVRFFNYSLNLELGMYNILYGKRL
jgi:hypothetical protein